MMKTAMSIKEISSKLKTVSEPEDSFLKECQEDGRKGVTDLVSKWQRAYEKELQVKNNFMKMTEFERELRKQGFSVLAGIDEVGRVI